MRDVRKVTVGEGKMILNIVLLGVLLVAAYRDYREKKVYVNGILLMCIIGVVLRFMTGTFFAADILCGAGVGLVVLVIARLSREAVGIGDGVVLLMTGIFLGFWRNLELLFTALLLAGAAAVFFLLVKRKEKTYRLPFVPFLAAAFLIQWR